MSNVKKQRRDYGTGSISRRKDGTWTARMVVGTNSNGKPRIKALYGKTENEVKRKLKKFQIEFYKNDFVSVSKDTVQSYMERWLNATKKNELKPKSFDRLEQTLVYQVYPSIGHLQLAALKASDVQNMVNNLRDNGMSYSSVKKAYEAVNNCFKTGVMQKTVSFNPASGVTIPRKDSFGKTTLKYYTSEEATLISNAAREKWGNGNDIYRLGNAIVLDLNTGLRMGELLALKWADVNMEKKKMYITSSRVLVKDRSKNAETSYHIVEQGSTKTEAGTRTIDLNDDALDALKCLQNVTGKFEYVISNRKGEPLYPRYLDAMLRKIVIHAGLGDDKAFGIHALRHTFASMLFANNVDIKTISELLGHSDVAVTYNTYVHLIDDQKRKAVKSI